MNSDIKRSKIFNDPVYGMVSIPHGLLLDLIDHPYFQRLRRIRQMGLSPYVYPGALHTRFHHALGALHLMQEAIETLRSKDVAISNGWCGTRPMSHGVFKHRSDWCAPAFFSIGSIQTDDKLR